MNNAELKNCHTCKHAGPRRLETPYIDPDYCTHTPNGEWQIVECAFPLPDVLPYWLSIQRGIGFDVEIMLLDDGEAFTIDDCGNADEEIDNCDAWEKREDGAE